MKENASKPVVVVTGAAGRIGTRLIETLAREYRMVGMDLKQPKNKPKGIDWIMCDMTKDDSVRAAFQMVAERHGNRLASVVHLAAYYDFSGEPSPLYKELTVAGTGRLLRELNQFSVEQVIFSSSILVMKPIADEKSHEFISETSATEAGWDYPLSKLEAEETLRKEHGNIPVVVMRIAGVYDDGCHSIPLSHQIARIFERKLESYFFPGDSHHGQPFVHMDDLVECIKKTIEVRSRLRLWELFLVSEPELMSYGDLQDELGELIHGKEWPTIRIPKAAAKVGAWVQDKMAEEGEETFIKPWMIDLADAHYPVKIDHAEEQLGWRPKHQLRRKLPVMINRFKEDPAKWYQDNHLELPDELKGEQVRQHKEPEKRAI